MASTDGILDLAGLGIAIGLAALVFGATVKAFNNTKNKTKSVFGF